MVWLLTGLINMSTLHTQPIGPDGPKQLKKRRIAIVMSWKKARKKSLAVVAMLFGHTLDERECTVRSIGVGLGDSNLSGGSRLAHGTRLGRRQPPRTALLAEA